MQKTKNFMKSLILVLIASIIMSINIKTFVRAGNLVPGGITGLSLLAQRSASKFLNITIPYSIINITLNAVPAFIGFKTIGKRFTSFSVLMIVLNSFLVDMIPTMEVTNDPLLIALFGGLINGIAISIALRGKASSGGTDFIAVYLNRKFNISAWNIILGLNSCILTVAGFLFGFEASLYSIVFQFVSTQAIKTFNKSESLLTMFIITDHPKEIEAKIYEYTHHGSTHFKGYGSYKDEERIMLYSVISADKVGLVTDIVKQEDPNAFINIMPSTGVKGNFYQEPLN